MSANTPSTAPMATAAAPRARFVSFVDISALASSISSRTRRPSFSETSVTAAARLSLRSPGSAGKALEDQGEDDATGERGAHRPLGVVGRKRGSEAARSGGRVLDRGRL